MSQQNESFSVDILFSEPLNFDLSEIVDAVNADHPGSSVRVSPINPRQSCSTDQMINAILEPVDPENGRLITLITPGFPDENFRSQDHTELAWRSAPFSHGALDAVKQHKSYVSVSISPAEPTLAARFRAARQINAVSAVFAALPISLGVLAQWAGRLSEPKAWCAAAEQAGKGEWPISSWLSYRAGWDVESVSESTHSVGYTTGLKSFVDYEIHMESAPLKPGEVMPMLMGASYLSLQGGNELKDGDTIGGESDGLKYRIRRSKSENGSVGPVLSLLHPDGPVDEVKKFGPRPGKEPPAGVDNSVKPKPGFMRRLLGRN